MHLACVGEFLIVFFWCSTYTHLTSQNKNKGPGRNNDPLLNAEIVMSHMKSTKALVPVISFFFFFWLHFNLVLFFNEAELP